MLLSILGMINMHCHAYKASRLFPFEHITPLGQRNDPVCGGKEEAITHLRKLNHEHVDLHINKPSFMPPKDSRDGKLH